MTPRLDAALDSLFQPPPGGSSSSPDSGTGNRRGPYRVRVSRRSEAKPWVVLRAVPAGHVRASSQKAFLDAVDACDELLQLRADALANVRLVAARLAWWADWDTMTTRPTWAVLSEKTGLSRRTIARALVRLRDAGLVGLVATGRAAGYQPARRDAGGAEAAVYVLCVPSPLALVEDVDEIAPVDTSGTPTGSPRLVEEPMRARESGNHSSDALRATAHAAPDGAEPAQKRAGAKSGPTLSPVAGRRARLDERWRQARALQARIPVLRAVTDRAVAAALRDFHAAGWSTADLASCVDWRPDGTRWPHDGATGVAVPARWLEHRLAPWRDETGAPRPAPSARRLDEARARAERQRAERAAAGAAPRDVLWADFSDGYRAYQAARAKLPRRRT